MTACKDLEKTEGVAFSLQNRMPISVSVTRVHLQIRSITTQLGLRFELNSFVCYNFSFSFLYRERGGERKPIDAAISNIAS